MDTSKTPHQLTSAELNRLGQAANMIDRGAHAAESPMPRGWLLTAVNRTCERLCAKGMLTAYEHGGYVVTEQGRAALAAAARAPE